MEIVFGHPPFSPVTEEVGISAIKASRHYEPLSDSELKTVDLQMTQGRFARLRLLSLNGGLSQEDRKEFEKIVEGADKSAYVSFSTVTLGHDSYPLLATSPRHLISQFEQGLTAMNTLVERYLPFANLIADQRVGRGYYEMGLTSEDIYGYAILGLVEAAARFKYIPGVKFTSYAYTKIRGKIIDTLSDFSPLHRKTFQHLEAVREALDQITSEGLRLGGLGLDQELERRTGLGRHFLSFLLQFAEFGIKEISLEALSDDPRDGIDITDFSNWLDVETLKDKDFNPEQILVNHELRHELRDALTQAMHYLHPRERLVLSLYYGDEELNLREIGNRLGVNESRACHLHTKALGRLREVFPKDDFKVFLS